MHWCQYPYDTQTCVASSVLHKIFYSNAAITLKLLKMDQFIDKIAFVTIISDDHITSCDNDTKIIYYHVTMIWHNQLSLTNCNMWKFWVYHIDAMCKNNWPWCLLPSHHHFELHCKDFSTTPWNRKKFMKVS